MIATILTAYRFSLRNLRSGFLHLKVFSLLLVLAGFSLSGIGSMTAAIKNGMDSNSQTLLGGDLQVKFRNKTATTDQIAMLRRIGTLGEMIALRAMAIPMTEDLQPDEQRPAQLIDLRAVDQNYPLYESLPIEGAFSNLQQSLQAHEGHGIVMDRQLATRAELRLGDKVKLNKGYFILTGLFDTLPDRTGDGLIYALPALISLKSLAETELFSNQTLFRAVYRLKLNPDDRLEDIYQKLVKNLPEAQVSNHRNIAVGGIGRTIDRLGQFLTLVAYAALMIACVGIAQAAEAYVTYRSPALASMKSLGATSRQLETMVILEIATIAVVAIFFGATLGMFLPYAAPLLYGSQLPIPFQPDFYLAPLMLTIGELLVITALFTFFPLLRIRHIGTARLFRQVVEPVPRTGWRLRLIYALALASFFWFVVYSMPQPYAASLFLIACLAALALLYGVGLGLRTIARRLPVPGNFILKMGLLAFRRPQAGTERIMMSFGIGLALLAAVVLINANLQQQIRRIIPAKAPTAFFLDIPGDSRSRIETTFRQSKGVQDMRILPYLRGMITHMNGRPVQELDPDADVRWVTAGDRGLTWAEEFPKGNVLTKGTWWPKDYRGPPLISIDERVAEGYGLAIGDTMTINVLGVSFKAEIASLRKIDWNSFGFNFVVLFDPATLKGAPTSFMATIRAENEADEELLYRTLNEKHPSISIIKIRDLLNESQTILLQIAIVLRIMTLYTIVMGLLVMVGALNAIKQTRLYETVLFKVLGMTRGQVFLGNLVEHCLTGFISAVLGLGIAIPLAWAIITHVFKMDWSMPLMPAVALLVVGTGFAVITGSVFAIRLLGVRPWKLLATWQT